MWAAQETRVLGRGWGDMSALARSSLTCLSMSCAGMDSKALVWRYSMPKRDQGCICSTCPRNAALTDCLGDWLFDPVHSSKTSSRRVYFIVSIITPRQRLMSRLAHGCWRLCASYLFHLQVDWLQAGCKQVPVCCRDLQLSLQIGGAQAGRPAGDLSR